MVLGHPDHDLLPLPSSLLLQHVPLLMDESSEEDTLAALGMEGEGVTGVLALAVEATEQLAVSCEGLPG